MNPPKNSQSTMSPHSRADTQEDFGPVPVFKQMKQMRRRGQAIAAPPVLQMEEKQASVEGRMPTYESLFEFAHRTGLPAQALSAIIEAGDITHIRFETAGIFVQVKKALADLEHLERAGCSQRSVA